jgi:predicted DCC family thiol-disulfide oxidoreductase YuxK
MTATFVYDDTCGFCSWWASLFARRSALGIVGFSALTEEERERLPEDYEDCAHRLTDDEEHSCGAAIEEALVRSDLAPGELFEFLDQFADYEGWREYLYREGAKRRDAFGFFISEEPPERRDPSG